MRNEYWFYLVWGFQPMEWYCLHLGVGAKSSHLSLSSQEWLSQTCQEIPFPGNFKPSKIDNEDKLSPALLRGNTVRRLMLSQMQL